MPAARTRTVTKSPPRKRATRTTATDTVAPPNTLDDADAQVAASLGDGPSLDTPPILPPVDTTAPPRTRTTRARTPALRDRLAGMYAMAGIMLAPIAPRDAALFLEHGGDCADALDRWAQQSPKVRKALEAALTGGALSGVIMAHVPLMIGLAANHDLIGPRKPRTPTTTVPPDGAQSDTDTAPGTDHAPAPNSNGNGYGIVPLGYVAPVIDEARADVLPGR